MRCNSQGAAAIDPADADELVVLPDVDGDGEYAEPAMEGGGDDRGGDDGVLVAKGQEEEEEDTDLMTTAAGDDDDLVVVGPSPGQRKPPQLSTGSTISAVDGSNGVVRPGIVHRCATVPLPMPASTYLPSARSAAHQCSSAIDSGFVQS
eukprot:SAG22_NODE_275_length_13171_cov_11.640606_13_plen_149_part_00